MYFLLFTLFGSSGYKLLKVEFTTVINESDSHAVSGAQIYHERA